MRSIIARIAIQFIAIVAVATPANAASVSVFMDLTNRTTLFPDGDNYLQVTVSDGNNGDIDFSVEMLGALQDFVPDWDNVGIQMFKFNLGVSGATIDNVLYPLEWTLHQGTGQEPNWVKISLYGAMQEGEHLKTTLNFSIFGVDGDTPEDYLYQHLYGNNSLEKKGGENGVFFVTRVHGISDNPDFKITWPIDSSTEPVKFAGATVVPIPAVLWLFGSGLGLLGWMKRRGKAEISEAAQAIAA